MLAAGWEFAGSVSAQLSYPVLCTMRRLGSKKELSKSQELHSANHHKPWDPESLKATSAVFYLSKRTQGQHTGEGRSPSLKREKHVCAEGSKLWPPCWRPSTTKSLRNTIFHTTPLRKYSFSPSDIFYSVNYPTVSFGIKPKLSSKEL